MEIQRDGQGKVQTIALRGEIKQNNTYDPQNWGVKNGGNSAEVVARQ